MRRAVTISVPRQTDARFPDRCIVCGTASPGHQTGILARDEFVTGAGRTFQAQAPCCRPCAARLHGGRLWSLLRILLIPLAGIGLGLYFLLPRTTLWVTGLAVLAVCWGAFLLLRLWALLRPAPLQVVPRADSIDYQFRDRELAREFQGLNPPGGAIVPG